jgi:alkanesulfonate monooxygenase SsuD/methylene tetrahydromethanopterin reductase-like flavin-dependent oxidoreductase (luciferase family)
MNILQRIRDYRHERYIKRVTAGCVRAINRGDRIMIRVYWGLMVSAILARSDDAVARRDRRINQRIGRA